MSRHLLSRALAVSAFAPFIAYAQPAVAEPFCDFLKQVLAARDNGFARLRGTAKGKSVSKYESYEGTLKLRPDARCDTSPGDVDSNPYYSCRFGKYATLAEGEPLFYDLAGQTRRCFPASAFKVETEAPGDMDETKARGITGISDGYTIKLTLSNTISVFARTVERMRQGRAKTPISYDIDIDVRAVGGGRKVK